MLNNNLLENRLNEYKNNVNSSTENINPSIENLNYNNKIAAILNFFSVFLAVFRAIVYGYSFKLIFSTDWKWWQFWAIGIALNFFLTYLYDLIHNK